LPIDRPKLSKALKIDPTKIQLRDAQFYADNKIDVTLDTVATAVDTSAKTVTLSKGETLTYDYLVIATGGDPRTLPIPGGNLKNIYVIRGANDTNAIEKAVSAFEKPNVVVVGSSFIGMEAAAILAKTANVTVCGLEKVPFERVLGTQVGEAFAKLNVANGVTLKMQALADHFEPSCKLCPLCPLSRMMKCTKD
jgi:NADPH-dependent 2,4-dienoyl-CoA reductase/sulfur reductase-like enzyme